MAEKHLQIGCIIAHILLPLVNLRKYGLTVNETGARSVKLQSIPPHKTSHSASAGYNVTAAGFSRYGLDVRTFYITTIYKGGDILLLQSLPPYFQFNATVQPLFIQGTGNPSWVLFNTSEASTYFRLYLVLCPLSLIWSFIVHFYRVSQKSATDLNL